MFSKFTWMGTNSYRRLKQFLPVRWGLRCIVRFVIASRVLAMHSYEWSQRLHYDRHRIIRGFSPRQSTQMDARDSISRTVWLCGGSNTVSLICESRAVAVCSHMDDRQPLSHHARDCEPNAVAVHKNILRKLAKVVGGFHCENGFE